MSNSQLSRYNATRQALDNGNSYVGLGESTSQFQGVYVNCESDQSCQLTLEWSNDNVTYYWSDIVNVTAGVAYSNAFINKGVYFRLTILNNSGTNMTRLTSMCRFINDVPDTAGVTVSTSIASKPSVSATLWNAATVIANDTSSIIDIEHCQHIDIIGSTDGAVNIDVQLSHDNTNWYAGPQLIVPGAEEFYASLTIGAQYLRLKVDAGVTITAHVDSKG